MAAKAMIDSARVWGELKSPRGSHLGMYFLPGGGSMHSSFRSVYSFYSEILFLKEVYPYQHEGLITVFEEGEILELDQPDGNVALVHEEASEEHEGDDQDRGQSNSELLV